MEDDFLEIPESTEQSMIDWRRYGHWDSSAVKARLSAFFLWHAQEPAGLEALKLEAGCSMVDASLALSEGFDRESAVAMELIVKAVIAKRMELAHSPPSVRVPSTHDLPSLWSRAELPILGREDRYRLLVYKSVLLWSGRYATPNTAKAWKEENRALRALDPPIRNGKLVIKFPIPLGWKEFDALFQMAQAELYRLAKWANPEANMPME